MPGSAKWSFSFRFPHQNPVYVSPLPHTRYMHRPSDSSRFYHPTNFGRSVRIVIPIQERPRSTLQHSVDIQGADFNFNP